MVKAQVTRRPLRTKCDNTNDLDLPTGQRQRKAFASLRARFALAGYTLTRTDPADGAVIYFVGRWGMGQALHDLDTVARYLTMVEAGAAKASGTDDDGCPLAEDEQHG